MVSISDGVKLTIPEKSNETRLIEDRLRATVPGELVTHKELSGLIHENVQKEGRHHLDSARAILEREGITFDPVLNDGVSRCTDEHLAERAPTYTRRARNAARRAAIKLSCVQNLGDLTPHLQASVVLNQSLCRTFLHFSDGRRMKALESDRIKMADNAIDISPDKMLLMFERVK